MQEDMRIWKAIAQVNGRGNEVTRGISDTPSGSANQCDDLVPTLLEPPQHNQAEQAAKVQAVSCGVEAKVQSQRAFRRGLL